MATDVGDMIERMEKLIREVQRGGSDSFIADAIAESADVAIYYNQQQLLNHLRSDNVLLKEYQAEWYANIKARMNTRQPINRADAHYSGDLFDKMWVKVSGGVVSFGSDSPHAVFMVERDGEAIFGLTPESIEEYKQVYMAIAQRMAKEQTVGNH